MGKNNLTIGITGATGGLGQEICLFFAEKGTNFVFIDRNFEKSQNFANKIHEKYPDISIAFITCDLSNLQSVKHAVNELEKFDLDVLILNSGVYNIPLKKLDSGFNNIFQINFLSQYYIVRHLIEKGKVKKVVPIGSIAYTSAKLNENDIDYSKNKKAIKIYGNSKRFLMFALSEYLKDKDVPLSISHPGISATNMINNYAKCIRPIVKLCTKILFSSPKKAAKVIAYAVENECEMNSWIGPRVFNVWGKAKSKKLKFKEQEREKIGQIANEIYENLKGTKC